MNKQNEFVLNSVMKYLRKKINDSEPNTEAHRAYCDVYGFIKMNLNASYGVLSQQPTISREELRNMLEEIFPKGDTQ